VIGVVLFVAEVCSIIVKGRLLGSGRSHDSIRTCESCCNENGGQSLKDG
jgi:hypothetical protein